MASLFKGKGSSARTSVGIITGWISAISFDSPPRIARAEVEYKDKDPQMELQ
jgi:hypothetical protein